MLCMSCPMQGGGLLPIDHGVYRRLPHQAAQGVCMGDGREPIHCVMHDYMSPGGCWHEGCGGLARAALRPARALARCAWRPQRQGHHPCLYQLRMCTSSCHSPVLCQLTPPPHHHPRPLLAAAVQVPSGFLPPQHLPLGHCVPQHPQRGVCVCGGGGYGGGQPHTELSPQPQRFAPPAVLTAVAQAAQRQAAWHMHARQWVELPSPLSAPVSAVMQQRSTPLVVRAASRLDGMLAWLVAAPAGMHGLSARSLV